jgi:hypothetical protein
MILYYYVTSLTLRFSLALRVLSSTVVLVLCFKPVEASVKAPFLVVLVGSMRVRVIAISEALVRIGDSDYMLRSVSLIAPVAVALSTFVLIP